MGQGQKGQEQGEWKEEEEEQEQLDEDEQEEEEEEEEELEELEEEGRRRDVGQGTRGWRGLQSTEVRFLGKGRLSSFPGVEKGENDTKIPKKNR